MTHGALNLNKTESEKVVLSTRQKAIVLLQALGAVSLIWWLCWGSNFKMAMAVITGLGYSLLGWPLGVIASAVAVAIYLGAKGFFNNSKPWVVMISEVISFLGIILLLVGLFGGSLEKERIDGWMGHYDWRGYFYEVDEHKKASYMLGSSCNDLTDTYMKMKQSNPDRTTKLISVNANPLDKNSCGFWLNKIELAKRR